MTRGEIWLTQIGHKQRPVLILTRPEVIDVRQLVTVAEISTRERGLIVEVGFDHEAAGLDRPSIVNCDCLYTVARSSLTTHIGAVDRSTLRQVCRAVRNALAC